MDNYLLVLAIISIISIIYVWYVTMNLNYIADDEYVYLHTDEDKIATKWYENNITHSIQTEIIDDLVTAEKFLQRVCDIEVDKNLIVIGENLEDQYNYLTKNTLSTKYDPDADCIFDIRSLIGKKGEIAIIHDKNILGKMRRNNNFDLSEVASVMDSNLDKITKTYFPIMINDRWKKLLQLNDPNLMNGEGSYAYYKISSTEKDIVNLFGNVTAATVRHNNSLARINLLCDDTEFKNLLKRWEASLDFLPKNWI
jgi:hypothetical protein